MGYLQNASNAQPHWLQPWFHVWLRLVVAHTGFFVAATRLIETAVAIGLLLGGVYFLLWRAQYTARIRADAVQRSQAVTAGKVLEGRFPERVLEKAVERMLPKESPLARKQLTHLRIYNAPEHPHAAQKPSTFEIKQVAQ